MAQRAKLLLTSTPVATVAAGASVWRLYVVATKCARQGD
jgi:hypothetical protein